MTTMNNIPKGYENTLLGDYYKFCNSKPKFSPQELKRGIAIYENAIVQEDSARRERIARRVTTSPGSYSHEIFAAAGVIPDESARKILRSNKVSEEVISLIIKYENRSRVQEWIYGKIDACKDLATQCMGLPKKVAETWQSLSSVVSYVYAGWRCGND